MVCVIMPTHKRYLIIENLGLYEGYRIRGEAQEWEDAVKIYDDVFNDAYGNEIMICEYIPLKIERAGN